MLLLPQSTHSRGQVIWNKALQKLSDYSFSPAAPRPLLEWAEQEVIQTPEFVARAAITSLGESDTTASLGRITAPTLVIVGKLDTVTPVGESRALSEGIPNSTLRSWRPGSDSGRPGP